MASTSDIDQLEHRLLSDRSHYLADVLVEPEEQDGIMSSAQARIYLQQLSKRVHQLEMQKRNDKLLVSKLKNRLEKFYQVDNFSAVLKHDRKRLSQISQVEKSTKYQSAQEIRKELKARVAHSVSIAREERMNIVNQLKSHKAEIQQCKLLVDETNLQEARAKRDKVIRQQQQIKARLKRYEQFKQVRAKRNYLRKVQQNFRQFKDKERQLLQARERQRKVLERYRMESDGNQQKRKKNEQKSQQRPKPEEKQEKLPELRTKRGLGIFQQTEL